MAGRGSFLTDAGSTGLPRAVPSCFRGVRIMFSTITKIVSAVLVTLVAFASTNTAVVEAGSIMGDLGALIRRFDFSPPAGLPSFGSRSTAEW
jgi:hypothetical protein